MSKSIESKNERYDIPVEVTALFKIFLESCDLFEDDTTVKPNPTIDELKKLGIGRVIPLLTEGKPFKPLSDSKQDREVELIHKLAKDLMLKAKHLPGCYRKQYSDLLISNLASVQNLSPGTLETLASAVLDHAIGNMAADVRGFLALVSNSYRSFLEPEKLPQSNFPQPTSTLPALATFRRKLDLDTVSGHLDFAPFTLPANEVERLCGAQVAIVSLPSCYRSHPVVSWGCVAHEVGGHDVLHSYPGLLSELKQTVRELFYQGPDPDSGRPDSEQQFLGLLWQHWTEEAACDVYAVMNLGPSYGIGLTIYFAALSAQFRTYYYRKTPKGPSLSFSPVPTLPTSSRYDDEYVDYHPTKILSLYVVMGAIQALYALEENKKQGYLEAIKGCAQICLDGNRTLISEMLTKYKVPQDLVNHYNPTHVSIHGKIRIKAGAWVDMESRKIDLSIMGEHAYRVGYHIAAARLRSLNDHSIQDLESWNDADEAAAKTVSENILKSGNRIFEMGDDAQLFAGAMLAISAHPDEYISINETLRKALEISFWDDEIWGHKVWHPIASPRLETKIPDNIITEMQSSF